MLSLFLTIIFFVSLTLGYKLYESTKINREFANTIAAKENEMIAIKKKVRRTGNLINSLISTLSSRKEKGKISLIDEFKECYSRMVFDGNLSNNQKIKCPKYFNEIKEYYMETNIERP